MRIGLGVDALSSVSSQPYHTIRDAENQDSCATEDRIIPVASETRRTGELIEPFQLKVVWPFMTPSQALSSKHQRIT